MRVERLMRLRFSPFIRCRRKGKTAPAFAWLPRRVANGTIVWLEPVERINRYYGKTAYDKAAATAGHDRPRDPEPLGCGVALAIAAAMFVAAIFSLIGAFVVVGEFAEWLARALA